MIVSYNASAVKILKRKSYWCLYLLSLQRQVFNVTPSNEVVPEG
jgi:hypothetical protein